MNLMQASRKFYSTCAINSNYISLFIIIICLLHLYYNCVLNYTSIFIKCVILALRVYGTESALLLSLCMS